MICQNWTFMLMIYVQLVEQISIFAHVQLTITSHQAIKNIQENLILERCLFRSSAYFLIGLFAFWYWAPWAVFIFWILILCWLHHLQIFSSLFGLSFHFVNHFLCCAKTFKVIQVLFAYFCFYFHCSGRWNQKGNAGIYIKECSAYVFLYEFYSIWSYI